MSCTMEFSLPDNGNLIIGQSFLFTVTLSSSENIDDNSTISFYNSKNITVPLNAIPLTLEHGKKKATATVTLTVLNSIAENEEIYFSVKTSSIGFQPKTLQYSARTIDSDSVRLNIDTPFLAIPISFNASQIGSISTKIHTMIRDKNGKTLSGVPVFIKANTINELEEVDIYNNDKSKKINVNKFGDFQGIFVNSDNRGKVEFYISPRKSLPSVIELSSAIPNSTDYAFSQNPIFIVVDNVEDYRQPLEIITAIDGNLKSEGESKFWVDMSPCDDHEVGDFLLFFVNKEYKYYTRVLNKNKTEPCLMELPYFILEKDSLSKLSYFLIQSSGTIMAKSMPADVTYRGRPNSPWTDVDRIYEPCQVYSSFDEIIEQDGGINNKKISNHTQNPDDAGLFVRITGTNDNSDDTKVKLGSEVILTLYINSKTRTIKHVFKDSMPYQPDNAGGKTATLKFNIPYNLLNNNLAFPYHGGEIFFDYQIGDDNDSDVTYGGIWSGHIVTF
ncbi:hypothetical protein [Xenorhabdus cabanillasii]|uniref:Uncharacterized protein n=1 Tax=Xenorhabdus cabanillasii JM26 TaxID=1427517 RepID=W1IQH3_9GAMM|nr:hypothetical protein [Xenorhabdus cabanillasii]PHM78145.1 hypothetical protein Xcab_01195 [Xenorhabdus cabanillasii JM26]CDL79450.1 conserved hypothetical protein [Xenorhabdus cabanillasii JM26]